MRKLTVGSLFTGVGGLDLGFEMTGRFETIWMVENDEYCRTILNKHWAEVPKYGDVRELSASTLETPDCLIGGFPCQPVSHAGRRKGQDDPRWLWPHFARLVDALRPRYVVVENVPGILSKGGAEVVADLASFGYEFWWDRVFAATVGAPHLRERFYLIARLADPDSVGLQRGANTGGSENVGQAGNQPLRSSAESSSRAVAHPARPGHPPVGGETPGDEEEHAGRAEEHDHQPVGDGESSGTGTVAHPESIPIRTGLCADWETEKRYRRSGYPGGAGNPWVTEPGLGRVANGVPDRVDRLRAIGNAVVPQVAALIAWQVVGLEDDDET